MTGTQNRTEFVKIAAVEEMTLMSDRKGWRGSPLAEIRLGQHGGQWAYATGFQQMGGDFLGMSSPLGFSSANPLLFGNRADALAAAIARLRGQFSKRPVELKAQMAWLDKLLAPPPVQQLDLFG